MIIKNKKKELKKLAKEIKDTSENMKQKVMILLKKEMRI